LSSLIPRALPGGTVADTWALALNVMGATTTSVIIIGYAYTIVEKGWSGMENNRQMKIDALTACVLTFIFNTLLYAVAVEVLRPRGIKVTKIDDVALVIGGQLGPMGYWIFYIALFAAVFSSLIGFSYYAALPARDAISSIMGKRIDIKDRWFAFFMYISMILPLVWTFTKYGFVQLLMFLFQYLITFS
jgi:hypothetical protein